MPQAAGELLQRFMQYVWSPVAKVIFAAGFFLFLWGLVKFLWDIEEGSGQNEGKQHMFWGVIGMFIMVSIWGIISLILNTFGINNSSMTDVGRANNIQNVQFNQ